MVAKNVDTMEDSNRSSNPTIHDVSDPAQRRDAAFPDRPDQLRNHRAAWMPDGRTMFVNVQHPGETPSERGDPASPARFSNWPDFQQGGRPRSATVVVRKLDGGIIGT